MNLQNIYDSLNVKKQCRTYDVGLWQCPRFLFLLMGVIIIAVILVTYSAAQHYFTEPQFVALIVLIVTAIFFIIGHIIVSSFERIALASKAKSEFVSIMSHQLRTPLSVIKWQLDLLQDKKVNIDHSESQDFFVHLKDENQRMIHMINDLLELNRIEDNTLFLSPSAFSLKKVVEDIVLRRDKALVGSNVSIEFKSPEILPYVFADEIRIKDVVSHILDNAISYSINDGKIAVIIEELPKFIKYSVSDQGIGISKEDAKRIFSKFFRAESVYKYQTQGLGLRLYLAKAIIEASAGKIGFKSQESKGSTFWFTLPIARVESSSM